MFKILPELCSAELFSIKQMVPCDPVDYLNQEYGIFNWISPERTEFSWPNLFSSGNWSDYEWPKAYNIFFSNGTLNEKETLEYINYYSKYKLTKLYA